MSGAPLTPSPYHRCTFVPGKPGAFGARCTESAAVLLVDHESFPVPGGYHCEAHAKLCADEYLKKLGELWTVVPLVGVHIHRAGDYTPACPTFDLWVNGKRQLVGETLTVVERVAEALRGEGDPTSEATEVAEAIRTDYRYRCNRCHAPMRGLTAGEDGGACGACECGGLIEAHPDNFLP